MRIVLISRWIIRKGWMLTSFTRNMKIFTLFNAMILHIFAQYSQTAFLYTLSKWGCTLFKMLKSTRVRSYEIATTIIALKNQIIQILFDISMNFIKFYSIVAFALFRATFIFWFPWINATWTEKWTTWITF